MCDGLVSAIPHAFVLTLSMNLTGKIGLVIVVGLLLVALAGPFFIPLERVTFQDLERSFDPPSWQHPMGLDENGRDILARIVYGARISLAVGVIVVAISAVIGLLLGLLSGYAGGWVDRFMSGFWFNVFLAFPGILLAIATVAFLGASLANLILALCVIGWVGYARLIRAQVLKVREYDFVTAARALGASDLRILFRHILPNAVQPLIVQASLGMAGAILAEASLSFLGLGIPPPTPSWGAMLSDARTHFASGWHLTVFPAAMITLTVLGFNLLGDGLREWLDPRQRPR
jgi:peptide/nickel transport system permease protein